MNDQYLDWYKRLKIKYPIVTEEEWQILDKITKFKVIKKGDSFLTYGKVAHYAAFVVSGQFAFAIIDDEGNEKFVRFSFADDLLSNCESYYRLTPSAIKIVALENSVIRRINLNRLRPLYDLHMCISTVNLQIYQDIIEQNVEHQYILSLKSPVKRYRFLLEKRPNLLKRISLTNIARYLYVSREALSRARLSILTNNR
jgi:CRP-like cAMP-binding protein